MSKALAVSAAVFTAAFSAAVALSPVGRATPEEVRYIVLKEGNVVCDFLDEHGVRWGPVSMLGEAIVEEYPVTLEEAGHVVARSVYLYCDYHMDDLVRLAESVSKSKVMVA